MLYNLILYIIKFYIFKVYYTLLTNLKTIYYGNKNQRQNSFVGKPKRQSRCCKEHLGQTPCIGCGKPTQHFARCALGSNGAQNCTNPQREYSSRISQRRGRETLCKPRQRNARNCKSIKTEHQFFES